MKQSIRFFSLGLLTSAIFLYGFYLFSDTSSADVETIPVETLISQIESDGYRVITEDEFISFSLKNEEKDEEEVKEEKVDKEKKQDKEEKESTAKKDSKKETKKDSKKKKSKKTKNDDADKDKEDDKDEVKKATFTTKEGVVSQDIADILVENEIIDDRQKFLDYLDDNGYSTRLQIGKFKVNSDMSHKELAEVITTYPGSN
ncbi:hypothetical protein ACFSKI_20265 [Pseudogracilibacillus auburnensis]|uniref:YceG-like family protein n=1 Tax=Pseudogracilibacillus auburnensis TaxID=1494959 RepID=A0A2V3VY28_9BACI|nr:hypothetical protein [Pseudogracilibacillus auburnensis]PXW86500.1 hypothetical protein DFR56_10713 [Pseudogracilibacillus auburnensis]